LFETHRRVLIETRLLGVHGRWERADGVCHLIAEKLESLDALLATLEGDTPLDVETRSYR
jgi:error-prone DNA polymerase